MRRRDGGKIDSLRVDISDSPTPGDRFNFQSPKPRCVANRQTYGLGA